MTDDVLPSNVKAFIIEHIHSVVQMEVLLLLHRTFPREWSAADVGAELRLDPRWLAGELQNLAARGLLAQIGENPADARFCYRAPSAEVADAITALAATYAQYRVSVTNFIFAKPSDTIRTFADAFRLRKDK